MLSISLTNQICIKFILMTILAFGSVFFYWKMFGKTNELRIYKILIISVILLRIVVCIVFYNLPLNPEDLNSDASNYYYPMVQKIIDGQIPYRDFDTRYSLFFLPLFVIPVLIWDSIGAIVLTMIFIEAAMIFIYLKWQKNKNNLNGYRAAFLYLFSPISFYWVAVVGYNSVIIAFFILLAIILAEKRKPYLAGIAASGSFLFCKFIALITWPGVSFYSIKGYLKRTLPMVLSLSIPFSLVAFDIDILHPLKMEFGNNTAGNIWFLISVLIPGFQRGFIYNNLTYPFILVVFLIIFMLYMNKIRLNEAIEIDNTIKSIAFITLIFFIFMTLSIKSSLTYFIMILIFLVHLLVNQIPTNKWGLIFLAYIGSITFLEVRMFEFIRQYDVYTLLDFRVFLEFTIDIIILAAYIFYIVKCWKIAIPVTHIPQIEQK